MAQYNKVNVQIESYSIMAESVNIDQNSPTTPIYALNKSRNIDIAPNALRTNVNITYFPEIHNEPSLDMISGWKNNSTGNLRVRLNIGDTQIFGHLNSYSLEILPNQLAQAKASFDCFDVFLTPFQNQFITDTGLYNLTRNTGIIHYWNTKFLTNNSPIDNTDILQLSYNFNSEIKPIYKLGSSSTTQVSVLSAVETINVISEIQPLLYFNPQDFVIDLFNPDGLRLSGFVGNNYIDIPLTGFILDSASNSISNGELILFNSKYNKYY